MGDMAQNFDTVAAEYVRAGQAMDIIESYRDLTSGMMDLYLSSISNRTNEIMRVLTVVTAIFIPLNRMRPDSPTIGVP